MIHRRVEQFPRHVGEMQPASAPRQQFRVHGAPDTDLRHGRAAGNIAFQPAPRDGQFHGKVTL
jgi:hypothetical protein